MNGALTVFTSEKPSILGKTFRLGVDDSLVKDTAGQMVEGTFQVREFNDVKDLGALLASVGTNQAISASVPRDGSGAGCIVTKDAKGQGDTRNQLLWPLLGLDVQHVAQALHRHRGVVGLAPQPHQAHQRRQHAAHQRVEGDQLADRQFARQHQAGARPEDRDRGRGVEQLSGQADADGKRLRAVLHLQRLGVLLLPLQAHRALEAHALDGLDAAQRLHQVALGVGGSAEDLARVALDPGRHQHRQHQDRHHEQQHAEAPGGPGPLATKANGAAGSTSVSGEPAPKSGPGAPAIAAIVIGATGLAVGGITGALSLSKASAAKADCVGNVCPTKNQDDADSARTFGTISNIGFGVGGAGMVIGAVLSAVGKPAAQTRTSVSLGLGTATIGGTF